MLLAKILSFLAKEVVPFVLTVIVRNGIRKVEKKMEQHKDHQ